MSSKKAAVRRRDKRRSDSWANGEIFPAFGIN